MFVFGVFETVRGVFRCSVVGVRGYPCGIFSPCARWLGGGAGWEFSAVAAVVAAAVAAVVALPPLLPQNPRFGTLGGFLAKVRILKMDKRRLAQLAKSLKTK